MRRVNIVLFVLILVSLMFSSAVFSADVNYEPGPSTQDLEISNQLEKLSSDLDDLNQAVHASSTVIFYTILLVGLFVTVGIPFGGVIAWRYRNDILDKVDQLPVFNRNSNQQDNEQHTHTPKGPVISTR